MIIVIHATGESTGDPFFFVRHARAMEELEREIEELRRCDFAARRERSRLEGERLASRSERRAPVLQRPVGRFVAVRHWPQAMRAFRGSIQ